ncbi:hypothetical protein [Paracoccus nototheniae]|uniref:Uncharacterized protein n=1 Tax=Paracoccus nototheniae TaxID=2489002 RepID=A0ABW4E259_9RHOB|nr:hypothetical protein [Paracoccus nototheniae]
MSVEAVQQWFSNGANVLVAAQVFAGVVTALATIALWRVTRVLAVETKVLAKMTSQPFVVLNFESSGADPTAINLTLRNTGNATAFDVKLRITPAPPQANGQPAANPEQKAAEVSLLPPGQVLPLQGVMSRDVGDAVYEVWVSWSRMPGSSEREELTYKTEPEHGFRGGFHTKNVHHVVAEIEKLRKELAKK